MPTQADTLRQYLALTAFQPDWRGHLLLGIGLGEPGRTLALASLAAGAASLFLEEDSLRLRAAGRDVTFTVTTLDEALRALKNEIRQRRSIAVALAGNPLVWLNEMAERGVRPHAVANTAGRAIPEITERGELPTPDLNATIAEDRAATLRQRRLQDAQRIEAAPGERRWIEAASTLFPRDLTRAYVSDD